MTSTQATAFGGSIGLALSAAMYFTVPPYHAFIVWSYGLVGINLEAILG